MLFTCIRKCYFRERLWKEGDVIDWSGPVVKCSSCGGKGCSRCGNIGREQPPHHFISDAVESKEELMKAEEDIKVLRLRAEFETLGIPYDMRWGSGKLNHELIKSKKSGVNREEPKKDDENSNI